MGKKCSSQVGKLAAASSLVIASLALTFALGPEFLQNTNATQGTCQTVNGVTTCGVDSEVRLNVGSVLTLALSNNDGEDWVRSTQTSAENPLELNLGMTVPGGPAVRKSVKLKATTNNVNGYNLTLEAATADAYLYNSEDDIADPAMDYFVSALDAGETTTMDLTAASSNSRWGYSLSDAASAVSVVPGSGSAVVLRPSASDTSAVNLDDEGQEDPTGDPYTGESAEDGSITTVYFFAKAKNGMHEGVYSNNVLFSATPAP